MRLAVFNPAQPPELDALLPGFAGDEVAAQATLSQSIDFLTKNPRPARWGSYLAQAEVGDMIQGYCSFIAAPDERGEVEIAYFTFPAFEGQGIATEMARQMLEIVDKCGAALVLAHTLPESNASTRILVKHGFVRAGDAVDPDEGVVWRWERRHQAQR